MLFSMEPSLNHAYSYLKKKKKKKTNLRPIIYETYNKHSAC